MPNASPPLSPWRRGPALRPGDRVAVVAPSGPVPEDRLAAGTARLAARYQPVSAPGLLTRTGFLAGPDGRRLAELRWALSDPSVAAVFCARGGYGALRYVEALCAAPDADLRAVPLVGFSDVTVLHAFLALRRRVAIHGPVVTQLGELPEQDAESLRALLEDPTPPPPLEALTPAPQAPLTGPLRGRLLGGNLEMLSRLCGTPLGDALRPGEPVVLLLEEVTEAPYRIDRALTQLKLAGRLADVRAVLVGDLIRCEASSPPSTPSALEVIAERFATLDVPVLCGAPIGHGTRNRAVPLGAVVEADPRRGRVTFLEGAVA